MQNFYEATVTRPPYPQLSGTLDTQVCIVGGGLAGLCTALGLVERGVRDVIVLDGERVGFVPQAATAASCSAATVSTTRICCARSAARKRAACTG